MMLLEKFKKYAFNNCQLSAKNCQLVLAVSGGIDSVVMVDLCAKAGFDFVLAHCNFQLRGEESTRDENFVKEIGNKYQKQVLVKTFDTKEYAEQNKLSIQVAARQLRYEWFKEIVDGNTHNSLLTTHLCTAHHADDNIETLLLNFFRGCGISGLHGILSKQNNIVRPLLFAKREEIVGYAKENNLDWVEDSSNASDKYSRNFIRHQVLPLMKTIYPNVDDNLLSNIERFKEVEEVYNSSINQTKSKLVEEMGNEVHIPILKLKKHSPLKTIIYEVTKDFGFAASQAEEVIKILDAENGSFIASSSYRIIKNRNWLIIAPQQSLEASNILVEEGTKEVVFKEGKLVLQSQSTVNREPSTDQAVASLNADAITWPLLLRPYKQGDYFYPLGMMKKKKLSKFFIDSKLSKTAKEKVWVLESNKRIVWVIGYRIDERFKVQPTTQNILAITLAK